MPAGMQVGSAAVGAWIAQIVYCVLLVVTVARRRTGLAAVFAALWALGYFGLPRLGAGLFVMSYVAVLDIAMVFVVIGRDVRLS